MFNKRYYKFIILALLLMVGSVGAVPVEEWNKTYSNVQIKSMQQTSDGGYILTGNGGSYGRDAKLIKTDTNGNEQWNKTFNFDPNPGYYTPNAYPNSVQQTSDGGYVIAGSYSGYSNHAFIIKTDADGNKQCENFNFPASAPNSGSGANSVVQTLDGGYILVGELGRAPLGYASDVLIIKANPDCSEQWNQNTGWIGYNNAESVQLTSDGGYIIAGETNANSVAGSEDALILKYDINNDMKIYKRFGGKFIDRAHSVQQTSDGGYIFAGMTASFAPAGNAWLTKLDSTGNEQWNKTYTGTVNSEAYSVDQTNDNGYIFAGDYLFVKTDGNGNKQWNISLKAAANIVQQTSDGGYILAGKTWLMKFAAEDTITPSTAMSLSGTLGNNDWYTSVVQVTLTASDNEGGSGVANTEYSLDNGINWVQYSNPFTVSDERTTTILYKSTDVAGNIEEQKSQTVKIDKTTPSITITSPEAKDYLHTESLTLNFGALDTISGIDSITSSLDGMTVINGQVIDLSTLTLGQHTLVVNAIDKAGNTATNSVTFNLIGVVPAIVDVKPDTLNKASQGGMVTGYIFIELPGYDVKNIDVSTIKLRTNKGEVSALLSPTEIGDHNSNGIPDLMVKFDRQEVIEIVDIGDVLVTISGKISGEDFQGSDIIHVIEQPEQIPEFPTVALPILSVIGLMFLFQRRKDK